jgi:DNA-binding MarR family transcriptional regulator
LATIDPILRKAATEAQKVEQLAELALKSLSKDEINKILANLAETKLSFEVIGQAMRARCRSGREFSRQDLLKLGQKGWRLLAHRKPKWLTALGLAIYGDASEIEALFG